MVHKSHFSVKADSKQIPDTYGSSLVHGYENILLGMKIFYLAAAT